MGGIAVISVPTMVKKGEISFFFFHLALKTNVIGLGHTAIVTLPFKLSEESTRPEPYVISGGITSTVLYVCKIPLVAYSSKLNYIN